MSQEIFHYDPSEKFFVGREVIDDRPEGVGLPAHSTAIAPPLRNIPEGKIPVFNGKGWDIVDNNFWTPKRREINYDAGREAATYQPIALSIYDHQFPNYPSLPQLCNSALVTQAIIQRVRLIHKKFDHIVQLHQDVTSSKTPILLDMPEYDKLKLHPSLIYQYKLESETIIYLMRRIIDTLVQLTYLLTSYSEFENTKTIRINEIGHLLRNAPKQEKDKVIVLNIHKIVFGDEVEYTSDDTNFLPIINDLFNSLKHCLIHDESYVLTGSNMPTITSFQAKRNNHTDEILYHNHNAYHIMMGFQDNLLRILENQRIYQKQHK